MQTDFTCTMIEAAILCTTMQYSASYHLSLRFRSSHDVAQPWKAGDACHTCKAYMCTVGGTNSGVLLELPAQTLHHNRGKLWPQNGALQSSRQRAALIRLSSAAESTCSHRRDRIFPLLYLLTSTKRLLEMGMPTGFGICSVWPKHLQYLAQCMCIVVGLLQAVLQ